MPSPELTEAEVRSIACGTYVLDTMQRSPGALDFFSRWEFLDGFGPTTPNRR